MTINVEIPSDLQPFLREAVDSGAFANEQEAVTQILRLAAGTLESHQQIKKGVRRSLDDEQAGRVQVADFADLKRQIANTSET